MGLKMTTDKSNWSVDYLKKYPIITLTDCNGHISKYDINEIVELAEAKMSMKTFALIEKIVGELK